MTVLQTLTIYWHVKAQFDFKIMYICLSYLIVHISSPKILILILKNEVSFKNNDWEKIWMKHLSYTSPQLYCF